MTSVPVTSQQLWLYELRPVNILALVREQIMTPTLSMKWEGIGEKRVGLEKLGRGLEVNIIRMLYMHV